jgi:hypothetical protein
VVRVGGSYGTGIENRPKALNSAAGLLDPKLPALPTMAWRSKSTEVHMLEVLFMRFHHSLMFLMVAIYKLVVAVSHRFVELFLFAFVVSITAIMIWFVAADDVYTQLVSLLIEFKDFQLFIIIVCCICNTASWEEVKTRRSAGTYQLNIS